MLIYHVLTGTYPIDPSVGWDMLPHKLQLGRRQIEPALAAFRAR